MTKPVAAERPAPPALSELAVAENAWQIEPGLFRILLPLPWNVPFVNAYLVSGGGRHMLIDCGLNWTPGLRALGHALKAAGVPPGGLDLVVLTHRHPDHSGAAGPVVERWGGRTLLHPVDIASVQPPRGAFAAWMRRHGAGPDEAAGFASGADGRRPVESLPNQIDPLRSGEPLALGPFRFEVIETPGHSPGHVMLREETRRWVFCGDHVLPQASLNVWAGPADEPDAAGPAGAPESAVPPAGDPLSAYLDALHRAAGVPARLVLPGHGLPWRGDLRGAAAAMADLHRRFARRLLDLLDGDPLTARELVARDRPGVRLDAETLRWSLGETLAALWHLRRGGAVRDMATGAITRWERGEPPPH